MSARGDMSGIRVGVRDACQFVLTVPEDKADFRARLSSSLAW